MQKTKSGRINIPCKISAEIMNVFETNFFEYNSSSVGLPYSSGEPNNDIRDKLYRDMNMVCKKLVAGEIGHVVFQDKNTNVTVFSSSLYPEMVVREIIKFSTKFLNWIIFIFPKAPKFFFYTSNVNCQKKYIPENNNVIKVFWFV